MFSYHQAAAVTDSQLAALSDVQKTALAMVLTPREDRLVDFRGEDWFKNVSLFHGYFHFSLFSSLHMWCVNDSVIGLLSESDVYTYTVSIVDLPQFNCDPAGRSLGLRLGHSPAGVILGLLMVAAWPHT